MIHPEIGPYQQENHLLLPQLQQELQQPHASGAGKPQALRKCRMGDASSNIVQMVYETFSAGLIRYPLDESKSIPCIEFGEHVGTI